jgi:hypothetical protein
LRKVNESGTVIGRVSAGTGGLIQKLKVRREAKEFVALNWPFYKSMEVGSE